MQSTQSITDSSTTHSDDTEALRRCRWRVVVTTSLGKVVHGAPAEVTGALVRGASAELLEAKIGALQIVYKGLVLYTRNRPTSDQLAQLDRHAVEFERAMWPDHDHKGELVTLEEVGPTIAVSEELAWYRDLFKRATVKPEILSNTTGTRWAIIPTKMPEGTYLQEEPNGLEPIHDLRLGDLLRIVRARVRDLGSTVEHAVQILAELGVLDPPTELLRAQLMLEHAKNARDLAHGNNKAFGLAPPVLGDFDVVEEAAAGLRNRLLRAAPMGASINDPTMLTNMAFAAATEVGVSTDVHVETANAEFSSRYVQFLLRRPDGGNSGAYQHGIAIVAAVWANGKKHVFPRPILVAAGEGLKDPRQPFDYRDLVRALHAAGLRTNDRIDGDSAA